MLLVFIDIVGGFFIDSIEIRTIDDVINKFNLCIVMWTQRWLCFNTKLEVEK